MSRRAPPQFIINDRRAPSRIYNSLVLSFNYVRFSMESRLLRAIALGDIDTVRSTVDSGLDRTSLSKALKAAAESAQSHIASLFLEAGADVDAQLDNGETALISAARVGNLELVNLLADRCRDTRNRRRALLQAIERKHDLLVVLPLLKLPDDFTFESESGIDFLGSAANAGHADVVQYFILNSVPQRKPRARWTSALHLAAAKGNLDIVRLLVDAPQECGVNVQLKNEGGKTPLMVACYNNQPSVALYLIEQSSARDLDTQDDFTLTALHITISRARNVDLVRALLEGGADPDLRWQGDLTPLMIAIETRCPEIAEALIDEGARTDLQNAQGHTAADLARRAGYGQLQSRLGVETPQQAPSGRSEDAALGGGQAVSRTTSSHGEHDNQASQTTPPLTTASAGTSSQQGSSSHATDNETSTGSFGSADAPESFSSVADIVEAANLSENELSAGSHDERTGQQMYLTLLNRLFALVAVSHEVDSSLARLNHWLRQHDNYLPRHATAARREVQALDAMAVYFRLRNTGQQLRTVQDLDSALAKFRHVIALYPASEQRRKGLACFFNTLCRFRLDITAAAFPDVDESVIIVEEALTAFDQLPPTSEEKISSEMIEFVLADLYSLQYKRAPSRELAAAIALHRRNAVNRQPGLWSRYPGRLYDLSESLEELYQQTGNKEVLREAIGTWRKYLVQVDGVASGKILGSNQLAWALCKMYHAEPVLDYLKEARRLVESALALIPARPNWNRTQNHAEVLTNYSNILSDLYAAQGSFEDLKESIKAIRQALLMSQASDPPKAVKLTNLATRHEMLYVKTNQLSDLQSGIAFAKQALAIRRSKPSELSLTLNSLGNLLDHLAKRSSSPSSLRSDYKVLTRVRAWAAWLEGSRVVRAKYLHNLAGALSNRYELFVDEEDLQRSISFGFKCLRASSVGNADWSMYLTGQGTRFALLFDRSKDPRDLSIAIDFSQTAVNVKPDFAEAHINLGAALVRRARETDQSKLQDMIRARDCFERAMAMPSAILLQRVDAGIRTSEVCATGLGDPERASAAVKRVAEMIPQLYSSLRDRFDLYHIFRRLKGLPQKIGCAFVAAVKPVGEALEWMERTRGIISALTIASGKLQGMPSQDRVEETTDQIGKLQIHHPVSYYEETSARDVSATDETFNPQFLAEEAIRLAGKDYIVDFLVYEGYDKQYAILIGGGSIKLLELPGLSPFSIPNAAKQIVGPDRITNVTNSTAAKNNKQFRSDLEWLWNTIVKPILRELQLLRPTGDQSSLPHIRWISTGLIGLMPFHAAGDGKLGSMENTMDHVVSSYSTSLKAMRHARARARNARFGPEPKASFIGVPKVSDPGYKDLSESVRLEWQGFQGAMPHATEYLYPSVDRALALIASSHFCHLTCHGEMDSNDPSNSRLVLAENPRSPIEPLTVGSICQLSSNDAFLVFLAACSTAENGAEDLLDEVLHLASTFQLVGFPHVIGALWPANDYASRILVEQFYRNIGSCGDGMLQDAVVARCLHEALVHLRRMNILEEQPLAWASFVHFGS